MIISKWINLAFAVMCGGFMFAALVAGKYGFVATWFILGVLQLIIYNMKEK